MSFSPPYGPDNILLSYIVKYLDLKSFLLLVEKGYLFRVPPGQKDNDPLLSSDSPS